MRQKILFLIALLYVMVQGAWAQVEIPDPTHFDDTWDGTTKTQPVYDASSGYVIIEKASELAYLNDHFTDDAGGGKYYYNQKYLLKANIDMGDAVSWIPLDRGHFRDFQGEFHGENHTIRIHIWGTDDNGQGFICDNSGIVQDLHLTGKIEVGNSRTVGAIAAGNTGHIKNCWVSADVSSTHYSGLNNARLGGIVGFNSSTQDDTCGKIEYCCMTGNVSNSGNNSGVGGILGEQDQCNGIISHIMFYGTRINDHDQDNLWVGSLSAKATFENYHSTDDLGDDDALNNYLSSFSGNDLYRYALKHPHAVNVTTVGQGSVTVSAGGENNILGARPHQEVTLTTPSGMNAEVTATDADGNNVKLFGNSGASGYTFIMQNRPVNVHVVFTVPDWPRQGSGTTDSPYLITSADDWNEFALSVNAGINHSGKCVKLTNDISIWMMAGASETNSFQGTFDGDGHTLTFNCNNTTSADTAPFRYTKNAIIKNLRTAGSITTDAMNAAGIVGDVTGSLDLTNCSSSVTISSSRSDADFHGGLVASNNGSVTISGCVFDGSFVATVAHTNQYGTTFCGGLVGMSNVNSSTTITNSLVATTSVSEGMVSNTFVGYSDGSSTLNITNSYFVATTNLPGNEGTQAVAAATATANLGDLVQDYGMVKAYQNGIFYDGTYYMVPATLSGSGTELAPYTISSLYEWNSFAYHVNNGTTYSGQYVKLTEDISVETMAGVWSDTQSERRVFSGTFDGDGHTLTINVSNQGRFAAPFKCVSDATIRNLRTAGTIDGTGNSDGKLLAGIVGVSFGNTTISGCVSSVTLTTAFGTDAALAGLVAGTKGGSLTIDGCVFDGSMTGASNTRCAGIAGFEYEATTTTITNTLFAPATLTVSTTDDTYTKTFTRDGDATITNCYYTKVLGAAQGTQAIVAITAPTDLSNLVEDYGMVKAYAHGILVGGTYYGVSAGNVSLADDDDNSTKISNANGYVADVTLSGRTLYKDGAWNTICLPFSVTLAGSPLDGATVRALESASISGSTLNLTFGDAVMTLEAGTPYIIKWESGDNLVSPVFSGVTIDKTDRNYDNAAEGDARVRFLGTYKSTAFDAEDKSILLMGGENTLYYPTAGAGIGAQRAYFKIGGDGALLARRLTAFNIDFGDDEATGIISLSTDSKDSKDNAAWYSLDGRKLQGKPSRAGVYINNGIKIVIK